MYCKNGGIIAACKEMCPDHEFNMRTTNNLVNTLEKKILKYLKMTNKFLLILKF
jgi:hypothetical protein